VARGFRTRRNSQEVIVDDAASPTVLVGGPGGVVVARIDAPPKRPELKKDVDAGQAR
jgi:hypothetical protein